MRTRATTLISLPSSAADVDVPVVLPKRHALQREIYSSPAKRKVIVVGRRSGKTTGAAIDAVAAMMLGRRVLYAAPTADQTSAFWDCATSYLGVAVSLGAVMKHETTRLLSIPGGGRIRAKTAWNADTLRSDHCDELILDEFAIMDPDVLGVALPMLADTDGNLRLIFTPKRKNHAHAKYVRALQDGVRWRAWHAPSHVNPHLSAAVLAELAEDMTEDEYRQEILAEFLENDGAVFRNVAACLVPARAIMPGLWRGEDEPDAHDGHRVVIGVDWGKVGDYTAVSVVCATCAREVELFRGRGDDYVIQRQRLADQCARWHVSSGKAESNSMGGPILEMLRRGESGGTDGDGYAPLPVRGFETTAASKPPLIENLALSLERAEVRWLDVPVATAELEAYERKSSAATGRASYSAPAGVHDDTVIARALARKEAGRLGTMATTRLWA
jgi:hypothetical protein